MYPQQQQTQLNQSIEATRALMQQVKNAQNPQAMLAQILQNNPSTPFISNLLKNGQNLEGIARSLAQAKGEDINDIIRRLSGGL